MNVPKTQQRGGEFMDNTELSYSAENLRADKECAADAAAVEACVIETEELQAEEPYVTSEAEIVLKIENLRRSYGDIRALDGVSFKIPEGKIIGLLGPNGSGIYKITKRIN